MNHLTLGLWLAADLAEEANKGPDYGKASPVGLLVVVLLLLGVFFLIWSMNRHLKRVPASFDTGTGTGTGTGTDTATGTQTGADAATQSDAAAQSNVEVPPRESTG